MLRIDLELLDGEPDGRVSIGRLVLAYVLRLLPWGICESAAVLCFARLRAPTQTLTCGRRPSTRNLYPRSGESTAPPFRRRRAVSLRSRRRAHLDEAATQRRSQPRSEFYRHLCPVTAQHAAVYVVPPRCVIRVAKGVDPVVVAPARLAGRQVWRSDQHDLDQG